MPANKFALLRYRIIDRTIRGNYPSKEALRQACEEALYGSDGERISSSTIDKDLWAMRNEGELGYYAPIKFSKEYGGYYYEDPDFTIAELPLSNDDLEAIKAAAETLYQFRDIPLFQQFDSAIEKIFDRMAITSVGSDAEVIQFERVGNYKGSEFLQPLYKACKNSEVVELTYTKFQSKDSKTYTIEPHLLKEYRGRWYLLGFDLTDEKIRTLSLDRITQIKEDDRKFSRPKAFDSKAFFESAIGITVTDDAPLKVQIHFSAMMAPYVTTQPLHESQEIIEQDKSGMIIQLTVLNTPELISTILGFGKEATVLSPISIQNEVKQVLTECILKYK